MQRNRGEVEEFSRFWKSVPGVDSIRIKEDETNLFKTGHDSKDFRYPCHYLWRGPVYVKQDGNVYPCCQSYMLDGKPVGGIGDGSLTEIWNSAPMQELRKLHAEGRAGEIPMCVRCCSSIPHPALVVGSLLLHGDTVRKLVPATERIAALSDRTRRLLQPSK